MQQLVVEQQWMPTIAAQQQAVTMLFHESIILAPKKSLYFFI